MKDPKKAGAIIVSAMLGKPHHEMTEGPDEEGGEVSDAALESAADAVLEAIKADDSKKLAEALKHFFVIVDEDEDETEE